MFGIPQCLLKFSALIFCPSNPYSSVHGMCHPCCGAPDDGSNRSSLIFQDVCFKLPIYPMLPLITSMDAILHLVKSSSLLSDVHHVPFLSVNGHTVFLHGKGFATKICWRLRCGNTEQQHFNMQNDSGNCGDDIPLQIEDDTISSKEQPFQDGMGCCSALDDSKDCKYQIHQVQTVSSRVNVAFCLLFLVPKYKCLKQMIFYFM